MQMLSMLGLSQSDIDRIDVTMRALSSLPEKIDALTVKIENLDKVVKNGSESGSTDGRSDGSPDDRKSDGKSDEKGR